MISAEALAQALDGTPAGTGKWRALCPAHEDSKPSLSITTGRHGVVFVCRAGCMQAEVIEALRARGIWHRTRDQSPARVAPYRAPEPQRLDLPVLIQQLDRLLVCVELVDADAPYIVLGEILEGAAGVSYHCVSRIAHALQERSPHAQRQVARWMNERYPTAVFENRP